MSASSTVRLAVAVLALSTLVPGPAAHAEAVVARVVGSVAGVLIGNALINGKDRKLTAQCRLYDREGREVFLPCNPKRPIGELIGAGPQTLAAVPAPVVIAATPTPAAVQMHDAASAEIGATYVGYGDASRYGGGQVVSVEDAYAESRSAMSYSRGAGYGPYGEDGYGEDYGSGYAGGYGAGGYAYGGAAYDAGGYAQWYGIDRARVAGRDPYGFLTWPGKRVR